MAKEGQLSFLTRVDPMKTITQIIDNLRLLGSEQTYDTPFLSMKAGVEYKALPSPSFMTKTAYRMSLEMFSQVEIQSSDLYQNLDKVREITADRIHHELYGGVLNRLERLMSEIEYIDRDTITKEIETIIKDVRGKAYNG